MLRSVIAVLLGLLVAVIVLIGMESISHTLFPPPSVDPNDMDAVRALMANLPARMFVMVLVAWSLSALTGGLVAGRVARRGAIGHAAVIGVLLTVGAIANFVMLPHPVWVVIVGLGSFLPMSVLGGWLGARPAPAP